MTAWWRGSVDHGPLDAPTRGPTRAPTRGSTRAWIGGGRIGGGRAAEAAGLCWLALLLALVWIGYVAPIAHFDVDVFLRAGAAVADGRDPYPPPGTPEVYSGFAFVYPYLMSLPFVPLSSLPRADELFIGLSVVALLVACRLAGAGRWWTYALVLATSCTITGLQMGTLNALLFCGLVALWRLRDSPAAAGVLAALLVYSKLFLVPVVLWLVLTRRPRAGAVSVATLAALFGIGELFSPVGARTYADMLSVLAREEAPDGLSLTGLLMNTGLGLGTATWAARLAAGALLAGCVLFAHRRTRAARAGAAPAGAAARPPRESRQGSDALLFAGVVAAALVASPIVWSHYLLLLVAPLLAVARPDGLRNAGRDAGRDGERAGLREGLRDGVRTGEGRPPDGPGTGSLRTDPDLPLAVFTAGSWLLVTPHLSTPLDLVVAGVVLGPLVALPLLRTARDRRAGRRHDPAHGPGGPGDTTGGPGGPGDTTGGPAGPGDTAGGSAVTPRLAGAVLTTALVAAGGAAVSLIARTHGDDARVIGAYGALVGTLALLAWAAAATGPCTRRSPMHWQ